LYWYDALGIVLNHGLLLGCRIDHLPRFMLPQVVDLPWDTSLVVLQGT